MNSTLSALYAKIDRIGDKLSIMEMNHGEDFTPEQENAWLVSYASLEAQMAAYESLATTLERKTA